MLPIAGALAAFMALAAPSTARGQQRFNRLVQLLEDGQVVFGSSVIRSSEGAVAATGSQSDYIWYGMEHAAFDIPQLVDFMQWTLDPAEISARGRPGTDHPVLVRIPLNGREIRYNQWMIKNLLDNGVHGIIAPFIETADQARDLITAMRYPHPGEAGPEGQRGSSPSRAVRFWGVSRGDYTALADLWGVTPRAELLTLLLIENPRGVQNIREIVQVPGVGIVMAATGDLGVNYGGDREAVEQAVQQILAACKEFDVPCAIPAGPDDIERRIREGFRVFLANEVAIGMGRAAAGRN